MNKVSVCEGGMKARPECHSMPQIWHSGAHCWGQWLAACMMWMKRNSVDLVRHKGKSSQHGRTVSSHHCCSLVPLFYDLNILDFIVNSYSAFLSITRTRMHTNAQTCKTKFTEKKPQQFKMYSVTRHQSLDDPHSSNNSKQTTRALHL